MPWLKNLLKTLKRTKKRKKDYVALEKFLKYKNKQTDSLWRQTFLGLRITWALVPLALLFFSAWFTFWLVSGIGRGELSFVGYETFLNWIAVDILAHVVSIVVIVMRFLFPSNSAKTKTDGAKEDDEDDDLFTLPSLH